MATYNIIGYNNLSDKNKLHKSLSNPLFTIAGNFKEVTNIIKPEITISNHAAYDFDECNYIYIEQFGRYYFVDSKTIDTLGRIHLSCTVDVLYSHRSQISNLEVIAARSSSKFNVYQSDPEVARLTKSVVATQKFPYGFSSSESLILAVNGSGAVV